MIHIGSAVAVWQKHVLSDDGEYLGAKNAGEEFIAYEYTPARRTERNVIPGTTSTVSEATLTLATSDKIAEKIEADDTVKWKDCTYTVLSADSVRKRGGGMYQKEYFIYLMG